MYLVGFCLLGVEDFFIGCVGIGSCSFSRFNRSRYYLVYYFFSYWFINMDKIIIVDF